MNDLFADLQHNETGTDLQGLTPRFSDALPSGSFVSVRIPPQECWETTDYPQRAERIPAWLGRVLDAFAAFGRWLP